MTSRNEFIDQGAIRELQARRIRMARAASGMTAEAFAIAVRQKGVLLSRERVSKLEAAQGEEATLTLLTAIAYAAGEQLLREIANPVEWLRGSPPIWPGPNRANPGKLNRPSTNTVDRPRVPVLTLIKQAA